MGIKAVLFIEHTPPVRIQTEIFLSTMVRLPIIWGGKLYVL